MPWTTLIEGPPGFIESPDLRTLQIDRLPADGDPVKWALKQGAAVGLLGIDLKTRRRNRMNGNIRTAPQAVFPFLWFIRSATVLSTSSGASRAFDIGPSKGSTDSGCRADSSVNESAESVVSNLIQGGT